MDDGDLGDNIEEETEIIEETVSHDKRIENDQAHLAPKYVYTLVVTSYSSFSSSNLLQPLVVCLIGIPHDRRHPRPCRLSV